MSFIRQSGQLINSYLGLNQIQEMKLNLILLFVLSSIIGSAQIDPVDQNGIGIGGYDLVSYFKNSKPKPGSKLFTSKYKEVAYQFSTEANLKEFESQPEKYLPAYDGFCALGVCYLKKISINPESYTIINGKLYLFFDGMVKGKRVNYLEQWLKNEPKFLIKAEELWPNVKKTEYKKEK
jgi:YHS domain-containing protein